MRAERIDKVTGDYRCRLTRVYDCESLMHLNHVKFTAVKSSLCPRKMIDGGVALCVRSDVDV